VACPVQQARDERPGGEHGEDRAGECLGSLLLGEGDGGDVGGSEDHADRGEDRRQGEHPGGPDDRTLPGAIGPATGWGFRAALGEEPVAAHQRSEQRDHEAGAGRHGGREERGGHRADHEHHLVERGLEGERGVELPGVVERVRPARADHGADRAERGAAERRGDVEDPCG